MNIPTLLRAAEHEALATLTMSGSTLDLGGDVRGAYRRCIKGSPLYTVVNLDPKTKPDIVHDLEKPLPIADAAYDNVLLVNVLEHIYNYNQLLDESVRVVRPGGCIVIVVPFLFPIHPSPKDFWRFSADALTRLCAEKQLRVVRVMPLGSGVFSARYVMFDRLMPAPLRLLFFVTLRPLAVLTDYIFSVLARALGKQYRSSDYALGYLVEAQR